MISLFIFICSNNFVFVFSKDLTSEQNSRSSSRKRGVRATDEGLEQIHLAKAAGLDNGKHLTYDEIALKANVSPKTIQRFFKGDRVDKYYAIAIVKALNLQPQDILEDR